jgi:5-formyltetrahydrofolate cyclo-ligase
MIDTSRVVPCAFLESILTALGRPCIRCCVNLYNKKPDAYHAAHNEPLGSEPPGCNYLDHITSIKFMVANHMNASNKESIRQAMLRKRRAMTSAQRAEAGHKLLAKLQQDPKFIQAETVGLYHPLADELDTRPAMTWCWQAGKKVALPCCREGGMALFFITDQEVLVPGQFGILEPVDNAVNKADRLDYLCVPSLAVDAKHYRVGYGKGMYDKFLAQQGMRMGKVVYLAYAEALIPSCLPDAHDVQADEICVV